VIKRMASNSFEVKKWLIGILSAIVFFKQEELLLANGQLIWLLLVPVLCFWYLDAFFLRTERLYREMYKWVVEHRSKTDDYLYDLNTMRRTYAGHEVNFAARAGSIVQLAFSRTLLPFYLVPILFITAFGLLYCFKC
jgi:hypothetical protein